MVKPTGFFKENGKTKPRMGKTRISARADSANENTLRKLLHRRIDRMVYACTNCGYVHHEGDAPVCPKCNAIYRGIDTDGKKQYGGLAELIGNVYSNVVKGGGKWKIVAVNGRIITLQNRDGIKFATTPELMGNYVYYGRRF